MGDDNKNEFAIIIGGNIERFLKLRDMTKAKLASELNLDRQDISKWCKGYAVPRVSTLARIADALHVGLDDLVMGNDDNDFSNEKDMTDGCYCLYKEIFRSDKFILPDDCGTILNRIMDEALNDREKYILVHKYKLNHESYLSMKEIGNNLHITRERTRQVCNSAIQKLRGYKLELLDEQIDENNLLKSYKYAWSIKVPLEEIEFSKRTNNALYKSGIRNLNDVMKIDSNYLLNTHGLGLTGCAEIYDFIRKAWLLPENGPQTPEYWFLDRNIDT